MSWISGLSSGASMVNGYIMMAMMEQTIKKAHEKYGHHDHPSTDPASTTPSRAPLTQGSSGQQRYDSLLDSRSPSEGDSFVRSGSQGNTSPNTNVSSQPNTNGSSQPMSDEEKMSAMEHDMEGIVREQMNSDMLHAASMQKEEAKEETRLQEEQEAQEAQEAAEEEAEEAQEVKNKQAEYEGRAMLARNVEIVRRRQEEQMREQQRQQAA